MAKYYVNPTAQVKSNDHEVHKEGCFWLGLISNPIYLGVFSSCHGAVNKAREYYPLTADGCIHCSPDCHHG